ncbi:50S ribosomal protein L11 methyltransferase [Aquirufa aurantiipilula]|uniref:50S ribosomal protein L11 methyltransferase n=1 Tax=Aquirufa aurantiipilula TaxID=2696561 RepID=UPI001CAA4C59|nr:50S ribosomal protein L11 methyltransferase [Aquirufa aurantiipilula]MBZ1327384.1 50S ribosomal protein L11 methyltransferase [Aquirufa aurantiipilula]
MATIQARISASAELSDILLAELGEIGFDIFEDTEEGFFAYCPEALFNQESFQEIIDRYQSLGQIDVAMGRIEKQNWNQVWESNYDPIRISNLLFIRASFHESEPGYQMELVINPKMSFGTGHHETTSLMVEALFTLDLEDKSVLDAGTGTGILAFVAKKLGANPVNGFDVDEWSVENSIENAALNDLNGIRFDLGTIREQSADEYDVVLANINRNILLDEMAEYALRIKAGGHLLLSGFYQEDVPLLLQEASEAGLTFISEKEKNRWTCLHLRKL